MGKPCWMESLAIQTFKLHALAVHAGDESVLLHIAEAIKQKSYGET